MSYNELRTESRNTFDEARPKSAPIGLQMQELEMQIDRIEKMTAALIERVNPILTPDQPRETKAQPEVNDSAETSAFAHALQRQVIRISQAARHLENLHSRIEL